MRRPMRSTPFLLAAALLLLPAPAAGQDDVTLVDQRAERVTWVVRPAPAGGAALGGIAGAVASRAGWREDLLVLQSGPREDARLVVEVERPARRGKPGGRYVVDVRAESIVVFLSVRGADARTAWPRAVYAEGFVRLVVESPQGDAAIEAEEALFDLGRERAFVRDAELRARPRAATSGSGPLGGAPLLVRAARLRALGSSRIVAEDLMASPCDLGAPHVALHANRLEVTAADPDAAGPLLGPLLQRREAPGGSDAMLRARSSPRWIDLDGVGLLVVPPYRDGEALRLPALPFGSWRSDWPVPSVRFGRSTRLGTFGVIEVGHGLLSLRSKERGKLDVSALERVEHYSERGTGGELGLDWDHAQGPFRGEGYARAFFMDDRADVDRSGAPIETEHRFWLRGLARETLPGGVQVDAEVSRLSDRGLLLEYFRSVLFTEKEQETYAYARWTHDALGLRAIGRFRLNEFQSQVEQLPEAKLDWVHAPLLTDPTWGGLYLDVAARAGVLRVRPDDDLALPSYRAGRGDLDAELSYKQTLGPLVLRAFGGARETGWTGRAADEEEDIDRFAAHAGWNLATTFWRELETPWRAVLRHELTPEVGTRHVLGVTRDPAELLPFDEVEQLVDTDYVFLRLRTRLLTDVAGRRRKLLDVALETRYFPRDHGRDAPRRWGALLYDVRLDPAQWLSVRVRGEHDLNRGSLTSLDVTGKVTIAPVSLSVSWRDLPGLGIKALGWSVDAMLTPAWTVGFSQQYDVESGDFLYHQGRIVRSFHCVSLEVTLMHDPQQHETAASFSVGLAPLFGSDAGTPFERDRWSELYDD